MNELLVIGCDISAVATQGPLGSPGEAVSALMEIMLHGPALW
jgi:hypothetical protein